MRKLTAVLVLLSVYAGIFAPFAAVAMTLLFGDAVAESREAGDPLDPTAADDDVLVPA